MTRLRLILQSKLFICFLIILTIIISFYKYNKEEIIPSNNITGVVESLKIDGNKLSIKIDNILVNYYIDTIEERDYLLKTIKLGDIINVNGKLNIPSDNTNFNLFNYRLYLKSKKIDYIITADNINYVSKNTNLLYKIKNKIIDKINSSKNAHYLYAFILGDSKSIDDNVISSYQINGISHLFSISGMHVSLLSSVILIILNKIKKSNFNYVITIIFLLFYSFLVSYTPSIMRSVCLFSFLFFNKTLKLSIKTTHIFIFITCLFLIYNPYLIHNVGFLFSFTVSFFLIKYGINDNYIISLLITSFIAFLVSLPISINNFFSVNLLTPLINLIFVPLISFIIFPLSLISFFISFLDPLLNVFINILELLSNLIAEWNISLTLCHIPFYGVVIYYLIIIFILNNIKKRKYKFIILIYIVLLIHAYFPSFSSEIHMIDVGQGDSLLIKIKDKAVLIDTGGIISYGEKWKKREYSIAKSTIIPYLKSLGIKKLDFLVLSHGDFDHVGEAINLINNFKVDNVIFNSNSYNEIETKIINLLNDKEINYYKGLNEINIGPKLLLLDTGIYNNENDSSIVLYLNYYNHKFLFMGDAGIDRENDIIKKYKIGNIDVLKVGHHGSKTSSGINFIKEINPKYSLISVGKNNRYNHPNDEAINNLINSDIYRTDLNGSVKIIIKNNLVIETCVIKK